MFQRGPGAAWITVWLACLAVACDMGEDIKLPTSPLARFALPRAMWALSISPNPLPSGVAGVTQTWTIEETAGVGFDVTGITIRTFASDSTQQGTPQQLTAPNIRALWQSPFIPPNNTITGNRTSDIPALFGGWWLVVVNAVDDHDHSLTDTLRVPIGG